MSPKLLVGIFAALCAVHVDSRSIDPFVPLTPVAVTKPTAATWGPDKNVFTSHMVLNANDAWSGGPLPARVWGSANAGKTKAVASKHCVQGTTSMQPFLCCAGESVKLQGLPPDAVVSPSNPFFANSSGFWNITISSPPSQVPVNITFVGASTSVTLFDVLFGATFLCSGQVSKHSMIVFELVTTPAGYSLEYTEQYGHGRSNVFLLE